MRKLNDYRLERQRPVIIRRPRRKLKWRPRWYILLAVLAVLLGAWVVSQIELAFSWNEVMDLLDVHNRERYTMLAVLGCLCVAGVWIAKILREGKEEEE